MTIEELKAKITELTAEANEQRRKHAKSSHIQAKIDALEVKLEAEKKRLKTQQLAEETGYKEYLYNAQQNAAPISNTTLEETGYKQPTHEIDYSDKLEWNPVDLDAKNPTLDISPFEKPTLWERIKGFFLGGN